jgi:hypothetical protein
MSVKERKREEEEEDIPSVELLERGELIEVDG